MSAVPVGAEEKGDHIPVYLTRQMLTDSKSRYSSFEKVAFTPSSGERVETLLSSTSNHRSHHLLDKSDFAKALYVQKSIEVDC